MFVCVYVCVLWGVFQGHREMCTVFAIEMQGATRKRGGLTAPHLAE